jgi:hypothetical protein
MYCQTDFEIKNHLELGIYRQIHTNVEGCQVVTLEGEEVCMATWRHIMGVPKTIFYSYAGYAAEGRPAQKHGNSRLFKPRAHIVQPTATLRYILDRSANHMSHRFQILLSSKKVVSKVLPSTWKWKESIPELNSVNSAFGLQEVSSSN